MQQPDLAQLQRRFWRLITAPRGVEAGLDEIARRGDDPDARPLAAWLRGGVERLDIYANMYFYRLLDVLREDFARCEARVGADDFHDLVTDYLLAFPPDAPSLRALGERFADFIARHDIAREHPRLANLARYEWARVEVFDAADVATLALEQLAALAPDALPALPIQTVAAARVIDAPDGDGALLVWRRGFLVYERPLDAREAQLLPVLAQGRTFEALCQALHEQSGAAEIEAVQHIAQLVARWTGEQLLRVLQ